MLDKILNFFGVNAGIWSSGLNTRRKFPRYTGVHAEVVLGDRIYRVQDWSMGGLSFETSADDKIGMGDTGKVTLKFHFPHDTISIQHPVRIVREMKNGLAAEFVPPISTEDIRRQFEQVLDSLHAQNFLESQVT